MNLRALPKSTSTISATAQSMPNARLSTPRARRARRRLASLSQSPKAAANRRLADAAALPEIGSAQLVGLRVVALDDKRASRGTTSRAV